MSSRATIETDIGERYRLLYPDGHLGGKALLSFLTALSVFCFEEPSTDTESAIELTQWFQSLQTVSSVSLHHVGQPLVHAFYAGDWNYTEDEYALFQARSLAMPLTEHEFKQTIRDIEAKWTATSLVQESVHVFLTTLRESSPLPTWWYDPDWSLLDMDTLAQTLQLAKTRKAEQIRIQFT
jgi:hypothetical protein